MPHNRVGNYAGSLACTSLPGSCALFGHRFTVGRGWRSGRMHDIMWNRLHEGAQPVAMRSPSQTFEKDPTCVLPHRAFHPPLNANSESFQTLVIERSRHQGVPEQSAHKQPGSMTRVMFNVERIQCSLRTHGKPQMPVTP